MLMKLTPVVNFINILKAAFAPIFFCQKIQIQTVTREKQLCITLLNEKGVCKMLMKLTPVVNFTNILQAAFSPIFFCQKITIVSREKQCKMLE
jgi:hypothetical protein